MPPMSFIDWDCGDPMSFDWGHGVPMPIHDWDYGVPRPWDQWTRGKGPGTNRKCPRMGSGGPFMVSLGHWGSEGSSYAPVLKYSHYLKTGALDYSPYTTVINFSLEHISS